MLDSDLAVLYQVPTKALNQAVQRNKDRFPNDFMFRLTQKEGKFLRSQTVTSNKVRGGRRYLPLMFTEHGVAMLSSVLNSKRAIRVNIVIMRTFGKIRSFLESNKDLAKKIDELEKKYDYQFKTVFMAIRQLMATGSPIVQKQITGLSQ